MFLFFSSFLVLWDDECAITRGRGTVYMWRCLLCFLTPRGVPATTTETFCNSWKIHGKLIHGKSMENPWIIHGTFHWKSMEKPWNEKKKQNDDFRGTPLWIEKCRFSEVVQVPGKYFVLGSFPKWIFAEGRSTRSLWCLETNPRTHLEAQGSFGDEGTFQECQKS